MKQHIASRLWKKIKIVVFQSNFLFKIFIKRKNQERTGFSFNKKTVWLFLLFYFLMAFVAIPRWNKKRDFLIFSKWNLFSLEPVGAWDMMWYKENKPIFYFRDIVVPKRASNYFTYPMVRMMNRGNITWIRKHRKKFLLRICQCNQVFFVQMEGSLREHIIDHKVLETIKKEEL